MKTCCLYNVPREVAAESINCMKEFIIKKIKKDDYNDIDRLIWALKDMQDSYESMMQEDEE